jgi:hypothetical protein
MGVGKVADHVGVSERGLSKFWNFLLNELDVDFV